MPLLRNVCIAAVVILTFVAWRPILYPYPASSEWWPIIGSPGNERFEFVVEKRLAGIYGPAAVRVQVNRHGNVLSFAQAKPRKILEYPVTWEIDDERNSRDSVPRVRLRFVTSEGDTGPRHQGIEVFSSELAKGLRNETSSCLDARFDVEHNVLLEVGNWKKPIRIHLYWTLNRASSSWERW